MCVGDLALGNKGDLVDLIVFHAFCIMHSFIIFAVFPTKRLARGSRNQKLRNVESLIKEKDHINWIPVFT